MVCTDDKFGSCSHLGRVCGQIGQMERTMFHSYCYAANFLAFLKDSSPDYATLLARLRKAAKDSNFQPERHWGNLSSDSPRDDLLEASGNEIAILKASLIGRDAKNITILRQLTQRHLTYRPKGKCPWVFYNEDVVGPTKAGRLLQLFHFERNGESSTAALVEPYAELTSEEATQGDYYRNWEPLAGRLYNIDAMPSVIIPAEGIVHHAIHREYHSKELKKMVRHLMPLSKVSRFTALLPLLPAEVHLFCRTQCMRACGLMKLTINAAAQSPNRGGTERAKARGRRAESSTEKVRATHACEQSLFPS